MLLCSVDRNLGTSDTLTLPGAGSKKIFIRINGVFQLKTWEEQVNEECSLRHSELASALSLVPCYEYQIFDDSFDGRFILLVQKALERFVVAKVSARIAVFHRRRSDLLPDFDYISSPRKRKARTLRTKRPSLNLFDITTMNTMWISVCLLQKMVSISLSWTFGDQTLPRSFPLYRPPQHWSLQNSIQ
jgi:hypothetical protein